MWFFRLKLIKRQKAECHLAGGGRRQRQRCFNPFWMSILVYLYFPINQSMCNCVFPIMIHPLCRTLPSSSHKRFIDISDDKRNCFTNCCIFHENRSSFSFSFSVDSVCKCSSRWLNLCRLSQYSSRL